MTTPGPDVPTPGRTPRRRLDVTAGVLIALGAVLAVAAVVVALRGGDVAAEPSPSPSWSLEDVDLDRYAADLLAAADAAHVAAGLPSWEPADCARPQAEHRARALVGEDLEHAPLGPVLADCAPLSTAGENLSRGAAPAGDVVEAWMGSAGHRQNIEDPTFTQAATACVPDGDSALCVLLLTGP